MQYPVQNLSVGPRTAPLEWLLMRIDSPLYRLMNARWFRYAGGSLAGLAVILMVVGSAIVAKEARTTQPLVSITSRQVPAAKHTLARSDSELVQSPRISHSRETASSATKPALPKLDTSDRRWFNGRPIRPSKVVWMQVTAYSPGPESCAPFADGKTATLHSVFTNAMKLVAADTSILPFGSLVSVPGYDQQRVVPVLDRGAAIKGMELDVLFPTAQEARSWGVQRLPVVIWEYADGKPLDDPRDFR
jgi:3D (Asp-Asp-Asp) domain-containing protein